MTEPRASGRMGKLDVHTSSESIEWETPQAFFDMVNREFGFTLDVCANYENHKCPAYLDSYLDGLRQSWSGVCWMNPPYGRAISAWVKKAWESASSGAATVVCLVPSRTDTAWWHDYVMRGEVRFIRGRLVFNEKTQRDPAPFPCALVIFRARGV